MTRIKGDEIKGVEHFTNEKECEAWVNAKRAEGFRVRVRHKCEYFMGERMRCNPPSIRVSYEP